MDIMKLFVYLSIYLSAPHLPPQIHLLISGDEILGDMLIYNPYILK